LANDVARLVEKCEFDYQVRRLKLFTTVTYAAFTLNDFDEQKRNLTVRENEFLSSKLKFYACNLKQAFYPLHKLHIA